MDPPPAAICAGEPHLVDALTHEAHGAAARPPVVPAAARSRCALCESPGWTRPFESSAHAWYTDVELDTVVNILYLKSTILDQFKSNVEPLRVIYIRAVSLFIATF